MADKKQKDIKQVASKQQKDTKPKSLRNWFGTDDDEGIAEHIRKKGTFKATRLG